MSIISKEIRTTKNVQQIACNQYGPSEPYECEIEHYSRLEKPLWNTLNGIRDIKLTQLEKNYIRSVNASVNDHGEAHFDAVFVSSFLNSPDCELSEDGKDIECRPHEFRYTL